MELETPLDLRTGRSQPLRAGVLALAAVACLMAGVPESFAQQPSLTDLRYNVARVEVVLKNGETREGFALAVAEYMNGILFVAPNTLLRDLEVPDNPTKKVSIRYLDSLNVARESTLLENSNARKNIALILAPVSFLDRTIIVWRSQGCRYDVAPGAKAQFIGVNREWHVSPTGQILTAFADDRGTARISSVNDSAIGSPVVVGTGIVGIIEDSSGDTVRIIDLSTIEATVKGWELPWTLTPLRICIDPQVRVSELAKSRTGLPRLVARLYRPGASYSQILAQLRPTDSDLVALFLRDHVAAVQAYLRWLGEASTGDTVSLTGGSEVVINQCTNIPRGYQVEMTLTEPGRVIVTIDPKVDTRHCTVRLGNRTYDGFWFINGHWIWLPQS